MLEGWSGTDMLATNMGGITDHAQRLHRHRKRRHRSRLFEMLFPETCRRTDSVRQGRTGLLIPR